MKGKVDCNTLVYPRIDGSTYVLEIMDFGNHKVHDGKYFTTSFSKDVPSGGSLDLQISTPDVTYLIHAFYMLETELEADFFLFEDVISSGGSSVNIMNRNRSSQCNCLASVVHTPTVTDTGTQLFEWKLGVGKLGGGGTESTEFIMKRNAKYLFRVNNTYNGDNRISLRIDWYEHSNLFKE